MYILANLSGDLPVRGLGIFRLTCQGIYLLGDWVYLG